MDAGIGLCPNGNLFGVQRSFKELCPCGLGLKPRIIFASNAALKRRSSTVLLVSVMLDTSKPQGLKPDLNACLTQA